MNRDEKQPDVPPAVDTDEAAAASQPYSPQTREAQEAHGGSMAPGQVDPTGHALREPPEDELT